MPPRQGLSRIRPSRPAPRGGLPRLRSARSQKGDLIAWSGSQGAPPVRAALVIVFTDLVDSTPLGQAIGDRPMTEAKVAHVARSATLSALYHGRTIKNTGDGVLAVFRSVNDALAYARAFQQQPGNRQLDNRVRAAIHCGFVDVTENDVFGDEVNCCGRIIGANKGPEIWLSEPARQEIDKAGISVDCGFKEINGVELKDFPQVRLCNVVSRSVDPKWPLPPVQLPSPAAAVTKPAAAGVAARTEPDRHAQNYERVDMVSSAEVVIDRPRDGQERGVYAQVDFIERLYVESAKARIEFGVQRAFVTVDNDGPGSLSRSDFLQLAATRRNAYFVSLQDVPEAISVCMDPDAGKTSLADLALPPTPRENYLCRIASATADVESDSMHAELRVSLDVEGLYLADDVAPKVSPSKKKQIEAIVTVAAKKNHQQIENGVIRQKLPVQDRER